MTHSTAQLPGEAAEILEFWFDGCVADLTRIRERADCWFRASREVDLEISRRFGFVGRKAARSELDHWSNSAQGALALVITLDQFPRNVYRGTPRAFACDAKAREIALGAPGCNLLVALQPIEQCFLAMPLEHAEDSELQEQSVAAMERAMAAMPPHQRGLLEPFVESAREHREIMRRFGRFPHRNAILDRASTVEEQAYLDKDPTGFGQLPNRDH